MLAMTKQTLFPFLQRLARVGLFKSRGLQSSCKVICDDSSRVKLGNNLESVDSVISASNNSSVEIEDNVKLHGYSIRVSRGVVRIKNHAMLIATTPYHPSLVVTSGSVEIEHHSIVRADIAVRFNGDLRIGCYTAINEGTEIRCDESIHIGDFVMISYECLIFDTNTHQVLPVPERRHRTIADFPSIGRETEKPDTLPVIIGNDVWIGQRAAILKGTTLEDETIVGLGAVVTSHVVVGQSVVGNPAKVVLKSGGPLSSS